MGWFDLFNRKSSLRSSSLNHKNSSPDPNQNRYDEAERVFEDVMNSLPNRKASILNDESIWEEKIFKEYHTDLETYGLTPFRRKDFLLVEISRTLRDIVKSKQFSVNLSNTKQIIFNEGCPPSHTACITYDDTFAGNLRSRFIVSDNVSSADIDGALDIEDVRKSFRGRLFYGRAVFEDCTYPWDGPRQIWIENLISYARSDEIVFQREIKEDDFCILVPHGRGQEIYDRIMNEIGS